jgi:hypothetical protein
MSDNKLLTENTIRRFMQLANTEPLADNFLSQEGAGDDVRKAGEESGVNKLANRPLHPSLQPKKKKDSGVATSAPKKEGVAEEEALEENEEIELEEQEEEPEMELDTELGAGDDMEAMGDMDAAEPEMGEADMSLTEEEAELLISLGERLKAAMGEGAEPPAGEEEVEVDPTDEEGEEGEEGEEVDLEDEDAPGYAMSEDIDQEELVNEVLKRVTKRLVAAKLQNRK